jgi:hypothetical protein
VAEPCFRAGGAYALGRILEERRAVLIYSGTGTEAPLVFDRTHRPRSAFFAIQSPLQGEP